MTSEIHRKIKAILFIALLAGAEVQQVQQTVRLNNLLRRSGAVEGAYASSASGVGANSADNDWQTEGKLLAKQMEEMMGVKADPILQEQANVVAKRMETIMADPSQGMKEFQGMFADLKQAEMKRTGEANFGAIQTEVTAFEEELKGATKQIETVMADPKTQEQIEAMMMHANRMGDAKDGLVDKLMDKLLDKAFQASPPHEEKLDDSTVGNVGDAKDGLVDKLMDKLLDRGFQAWPLHKENLDDSTLGNVGPLANPRMQASPRPAFPGFPTRSLKTPSRLTFENLKHRGPVTRSSWVPHALPRGSIRTTQGIPTQDSITIGAARSSDSGGGPMQKFKDALPEPKELKKMLPLASMFFCILFVYTILRDTKDVLVVTSGGAEVIPFLKTYMNLPAAIGFTALYAVMVNRMTNQQVFYTLLSSFAVFFGFFATVIYPNREMVHPIAWATGLQESLPKGFGPPLSIIKYWTFGLFYTMAELWGSVVVSLMFWGFANDICSVTEGKKWYPLFGLIANVALIFSGQFIRKVSEIRSTLPPGIDPWGYTLNLLSTAVVIGATVVMGIYYYMQRKVLTDPSIMPANMQKKVKKEKPKMGISESFKYLMSSSYIRNLAFLVIAYGTSINIVEVSWKGKLKEAFPNPNDYSSFMGAFSTATGSITLGMMLLGRWILNRFGWGVGALVTPCMLGVTGITFFSLILFKESFAPLTAVMGLTPLMMAVFVGAAQNILSKASKYSLFDPCKETAYIPLDSEMRTKGKASIDVIGNPLGKSTGAFIQQGALFTCGTLAASTPFLGGVLVVMVGLWISAARGLAVEFEEKAGAMASKQKDGDDKK